MNSIIRPFIFMFSMLFLAACSDSETVSNEPEVDPEEYKAEVASLYDSYLTSNKAALQLMIDYSIDFNTTYDTQPLLEETQTQLAIIKELQAMDVPPEYKIEHTQFLKALGANSMATSEFGEDYHTVGALQAGQNWNVKIQQSGVEDTDTAYQNLMN